MTYVSARVLYPDPTFTQKFVIIDKGSRDGIEKGMAVTDPNYFVGLVTEVERDALARHASRSTPRSRSAPKSSSPRPSASPRACGSGAAGSSCSTSTATSTAEEGELVVTACATEARTAKVPCGLIIGKVGGEPKSSNQGDTQTIHILPVADFDDLKIVAVIVSDEQTDGA